MHFILNPFPIFKLSVIYVKAFAAVANILGGIGMVTLLFNIRGFVQPEKIKMCGLFFLLCTLFEGLTLLVLRSNICNETGFFSYIFFLGDVPDIEIESVNCTLTTGSNLAVAGTVLWFIAAQLCLMIPPIKPVDSAEDEEQAAQQ